MFGVVAAGWLLGKGALQANSNLENRGFSDRKKITAQFFAEQHLAPAAALLAPIISAGDTTLSLDTEEI